MFIFSYTAAAVAIVCLMMAAAIIFKKRDRLSSFLVVYTGGVGLWNLANAFADLSWNEFTARLWCGLALIGSMFFVVFYIIFLEQFLTQRAFKNHLVAFFILLPALFFCAVSFSRLYITDIIFVGTMPAITIPGKISYFILIYSLAITFYGLWRLQKSYHFLPIIKRKQILYVKVGVLINVVSGSFFTIILPLLGNFMFFSLAAQFTVVAVFLTSYAIFKHQLLDIKVVIQRSFIFSILLGIIVLFYLFILFLLQSIFFGSSHASYLISAIFTCLVGIFSVPYIDNFLRRLTDKIFFQDRYDFAQVLKDLSETLNSSLDLNELILQTTTMLEQNLKIRSVYIDFLSCWYEDTHRELKILEVKHQSALVVPLENNSKVFGAIFFGRKLSGEDYTNEDINLFKTFAHQMALAWERSQLYEQIKDYSRNLEKKIEERTFELKILQEKQSQELFDIAHELQTPLTVIKGELHNFIKDSLYPDKIKHLENNIDRISNFINSLLRLAKMDFIEGLTMKTINVSDLLLDLVEEFTIIAQESRVNFYHHIEENIFINGDKNKLIELITNLVSNAMKYIANTREVSVNLEKVGAMARLVVVDSGMGIPTEHLPHLFERFYRGHKEQGAGTGLGLAICKKIIIFHNGEIKIKSQVDHGTCVEVLIPLVERSG